MTLRLLRRATLLFALLFPAATLAQEDEREDDETHDRAFTSGLSLGFGGGMETAGVGGEVLYYLQLSERWRIAPHVGVGYFGKAAAAGGLMASFGRRHRMVLDLMVGPMAADGGTDRPTNVHYGVAALIGYEWMSFQGVSFRSSIGPSFRPTLSGSDRYFVAGTLLAINYKFW